MSSIARYAEQCRSTLLDDVIPFWERHSIDREHGGYFTCLDEKGTVFDTDKFVWLQARQVWTFSVLCNRVARKASWLQVARHGADFLRAHGMDAQGNWYFALDRAGQPLVQPYNIFSDCFAAMAFAQYGLAADDADARALALRTYRNVLARKDNPKGVYSKSVPGTRPLGSLALPMILANLSLELEPLLEQPVLDATLDACIIEVTGCFLDKETGLLHEHATADGHFPDTFEGRLINPGHGIEAAWFLMDVAVRRQEEPLLRQCVDIVLRTLEFGWDKEYGGIFYFLDSMGKPPVQLEWDQKLWWVHLETLVALAKAYMLTDCKECLAWFERVWAYAWQHFSDPRHGEWWGYLNRRGEVLLPIKGGKWKGCFHVPRALYLLSDILMPSSSDAKDGHVPPS